ncbi:2-hydroxyacid dehydrogenase [Pseudomonas mandelii JR-1]|uniref:2-hydroxyacid dehydrogenase n=1 Tax=Pseudomonas mandelii JR-1 TaxID=1147786 RepID=A0A024E9Q8_9PSED|nr:2-hydroxyacid dehydrogenase [Pseudomonas mandelii JR-1]
MNAKHANILPRCCASPRIAREFLWALACQRWRPSGRPCCG